MTDNLPDTTSNDLQVFSNGEFELTVVPQGDSFRVLAPGLARALGFHSAKDMLRNIPDEEKGLEITPTPGGPQKVSYVTEPGFYRVIGQRQVVRIKDDEMRAAATRFQNWVFQDVLPEIRRSGAYTVQPSYEVPESFAEALELAAAQQRELEAKDKEIAELRPKAAQSDLYAEAENLTNIRTFARDVQQWYASFGKHIYQQTVFDFLHSIGLIIRNNGNEHNMATAWAINNGYAKNYTTIFKRSDLSSEKKKYAMLTPLGEQYAWEKLYNLISSKVVDMSITKPPKLA